jgi:UDP-GlcNAc:undecaprenyl-phosphate GlcNAc-1-phosphate transferase
MQNSWMSWTLSMLAMVVAEVAYFKVAARLNIIDKPNDRSSHASPIIRGGGIIFLFAAILWFIQSKFLWPFFFAAVVIIAIISFFDDVKSLNAGARFLFHLIAVALLVYQLWPLSWPIYLIVAAVIVCIGTLNAFNFMDGINGMAGVYALVTLISFVCIDQWVGKFTDFNLLVMMIIAVLIFLFFNFRKKARCFAGDVGSVTIAFVLIFVLLQLIQTTNNFLWPLLFLVYGTDSVVTIVHRIRRKENIFKAHRSHLYQYMANELGLSHLWISSVYGLVQAVINFGLVIGLTQSNYLLIGGITMLFLIAYFLVREKVQAKIKMSTAKG